MIRMIKGTYGLVKNGTVEPMTKHSPAFSINAAREAELVEAGVAVYEAEPESTFSEYNGMNMTELREAAAAYGVDASTVRSKKEVIALIEAAKAKPTAQSVKKMKARMRYIAKEYEAGLIDFDAVDATMQSYFGLMRHCSTHGLQKWIEKNIIFKRKEMADIELPQEVTQWELNQF